MHKIAQLPPNSIKQPQGFTLIELMIAVAIVAILAAIAIPAYNGYIQSARIEECANEVSAISLAQKQYYLENNRYWPDNGAAAATVTTVGSATVGDYTLLEAQSGGYFRSTYRDNGAPTTALNVAHINCDYTVSTVANGTSYTIAVTPTPGRALANAAAEVAGLDKTVN